MKVVVSICKQNKIIIVIEASSTGQFFIDDIRNYGYTPVILETQLDNPRINHYRSEAYDFMKPNIPHIIKESNSYQETLRIVKELSPILIIPGRDEGIVLASKLSHDLNLKGNNPENLCNFTNKNSMQQCLKQAGLRSIDSIHANTIDEALDFFKRINSSVYLKPGRSSGSRGSFYCTNEDEIKFAFNSISSCNNDSYSLSNDVIVQEYIGGDEFIVNSVVNNGKSKVVSAWAYNKHQIKGGSNVLDCMKSITAEDLNPKLINLLQYAVDVNSALGIEYGGVHGEFKIDEKGPALIETNCRPQGSSRPPVFTDKVFCHHETDMILKAFLEPESIDFSKPLDYTTDQYGIVKYIISPVNATTTKTPIFDILNNMSSYVCCAHILKDQKKEILKTTTLETSPGTVFLANADKEVLLKDYLTLVDLENNHFEKLFN